MSELERLDAALRQYVTYDGLAWFAKNKLGLELGEIVSDKVAMSEVRHKLIECCENLDGLGSLRRALAPHVSSAAGECVINLPDLNDPVIGRDAEARLLLEHLRKEKAVAIVAPSFFGKSSIIRRALRELTDGVRIADESVKTILYFEGELRLSVIFAETGRLTGEAQRWAEFASLERPLAEKVSAYWSYLDRCGPVWLVLDAFEANLMAPENPVLKETAIGQWLEAFLRRQNGHRVILASRFEPWLGGVRSLPAVSRALTEGLPEDDCVELWRTNRRVEERSPEAVLRELSRRLHRMPAAIRGAAEYLDKQSPEVKRRACCRIRSSLPHSIGGMWIAASSVCCGN